MNPHSVLLIANPRTRQYWVEIHADGTQVAPDMDARTLRVAREVAARECRRLGLCSYEERRLVKVVGGVCR
jgi:hypothetical protein